MKHAWYVKIKTSLLFVLLGSFCLSLSMPSAVTYTFSGGRFGDNLLSYCHAKWISYKYNIPLLYKSFQYSDQLILHLNEIPYNSDLETEFQQIVTYSQDTQIQPENGFLYVVPFFPESIFNRYDQDYPYLFDVDWEDDGFKSILRAMICPINTRIISRQYSKSVTVAVHVRKGTGWDIPNYRITPDALTASHPLRFAPDSFYIEQLKKIVKIFPDQNIYAYLFTDHDNPAELAQKYINAVASDRLVIDYRRTENNEFINVVDDFFALTSFDCIIRADSNFSFVASKLGNYKIQISPWHGYVNRQETRIDETLLIVQKQTFIVKEQATY